MTTKKIRVLEESNVPSSVQLFFADIMSQHTGGISISELEDIYRNGKGYAIKPVLWGHRSIMSVVEELKQIFRIVDEVNSTLLFPAFLPPGDREKAILANSPDTTPKEVIQRIKKLFKSEPKGFFSDELEMRYLKLHKSRLLYDTYNYASLEDFIDAHTGTLFEQTKMDNRVRLNLIENKKADDKDDISVLKKMDPKCFPEDCVSPHEGVCDMSPDCFRIGQPNEIQIISKFGKNHFEGFYFIPTEFNAGWEKLDLELNGFYETNHKHYRLPDWAGRQGIFCVIRHHDNKWYRAQLCNDYPDCVKCIFIDFGKIELVKRNRLFYLHKQFMTPACMCFLGKLADCAPYGSDYSEEAVEYFANVANRPRIQATIQAVDVNNSSALVSIKVGDSDLLDILIGNDLAIRIDSSKTNSPGALPAKNQQETPKLDGRPCHKYKSPLGEKPSCLEFSDDEAELFHEVVEKKPVEIKPIQQPAAPVHVPGQPLAKKNAENCNIKNTGTRASLQPPLQQPLPPRLPCQPPAYNYWPYLQSLAMMANPYWYGLQLPRLPMAPPGFIRPPPGFEMMHYNLPPVIYPMNSFGYIMQAGPQASNYAYYNHANNMNPATGPCPPPAYSENLPRPPPTIDFSVLNQTPTLIKETNEEEFSSSPPLSIVKEEKIDDNVKEEILNDKTAEEEDNNLTSLEMFFNAPITKFEVMNVAVGENLSFDKILLNGRPFLFVDQICQQFVWMPKRNDIPSDVLNLFLEWEVNEKDDQILWKTLQKCFDNDIDNCDKIRLLPLEELVNFISAVSDILEDVLPKLVEFVVTHTRLEDVFPDDFKNGSHYKTFLTENALVLS